MIAIIQRIFRGTLSIITTFVLMAAPIAAIIYFSEPGNPQTFRGYVTSWRTVERHESVNVIKESFATEPILTMVKKWGD